MLLESRSLLAAEKLKALTEKPSQDVNQTQKEGMFSSSTPLSEISAPPSITKVLHDIYQHETRASN